MSQDPEIPEDVMKVLLKSIEVRETPEQKAQREAEDAKRRADNEKRRFEQEEAVRLAVPRDIEALRKEAADKLAQADKLELMLKEFPSLLKQTDRWRNVRYYSKDVNSRTERFEIKHSCGCCNDSPLLIYPYIETPNGRVYVEPPDFRVGEKDPSYGGDIPHKGWDKVLRNAGIPEPIIGAVRMHFRRAAEEAKELAARIYDEEKDSADDEPLI